MNINELESILKNIEESKSDEDIKTLSKHLNLNSETISNINSRIKTHELFVNSSINENTDNIVDLFNNSKIVKEELLKSKKSFEVIHSQINILNKKYIDPVDKFTNNAIAKANLEVTLKLINKLKTFHENIKLIKFYFEKENNLIFDCEKLLKCFVDIVEFLNIHLKELKSNNSINLSSNVINDLNKMEYIAYKNNDNFINSLSSKHIIESNNNKKSYILKINEDNNYNLSNIKYIKDDFEWFNSNKDKILKLFRARFHEAIKIQV